MADRFRTPRKVKEWAAIPAFSSSLTTDATVLGSGMAGATLTVMRMLGEYTISPTSAPAALDNAQVTVGIGVVSLDAFTLGSTAMPDPAEEPSFPWLYWAAHPLWYPSVSIGEISGVGVVRQSFDIRSMRKINAREALSFVIQYVSLVGDPPLTFNAGQTRVLTALP